MQYGIVRWFWDWSLDAVGSRNRSLVPSCEQGNHMEKLIANDPKTRSADKYEIILYWSNNDDAFVAEVPELPGCMAHGDTQEAALRHVNQAMALWIDTAKEFGDPIPDPKVSG